MVYRLFLKVNIIEIGFELSGTTAIQIVADFETIEKDNFVSWLISRIKFLKGNHDININRQQIPAGNLYQNRALTYLKY